MRLWIARKKKQVRALNARRVYHRHLESMVGQSCAWKRGTSSAQRTGSRLHSTTSRLLLPLAHTTQYADLALDRAVQGGTVKREEVAILAP